MPYISQQQRQKINAGALPDNAGELNYFITTHLLDYLRKKGESYSTINEIMGILNCVTQEFYRRWAAPYEDFKIQENGDIEAFPPR